MIEILGVECTDEQIRAYNKRLIGHIFKILPMTEEASATIPEYVSSLGREIAGYGYAISSDEDVAVLVASLLARLSFLANDTYGISTCRKEVFKCINIVKELEEHLLKEV